MEPSNIPWLDYYQAVKRGDLATVQRSGKNFRLPLTLNLSALQLASAFGHVELVRYFLSQCNGTYDRRIVLHAAECANSECAALLLQHAKPLNDEERFDYYISMIQSGDLDCVRLIDNLELVASKTRNYQIPTVASAAICSGSTECVKFVYDLYKNVAAFKKADTAELKFVVGMAGEWEFERYLKPFYNYAIRVISCDGFNHREYIVESNTAFSLAAYFGRLDILKHLKQKSSTLYGGSESDEEYDSYGDSEDEELNEELGSVIRMALNANKTDVVKYAVENLMKPTFPYEYDEFRINEAFQYLRKFTRYERREKLPEKFVKAWTQPTRYRVRARVGDYARVSAGPYAKRQDILESDNHFKSLLELGEEICKEGEYQKIFSAVVSQQNVEAALCLKDRVDKFTCRSKPSYHVCLKKALRCLKSDEPEVLPSPVMVELVLSVLSENESTCTCPCTTLCPMNYFFSEPCTESDYDREEFVGPHQSIPVLLDGIDAIMAMLVERGCRKPRFARKSFHAFFEDLDPVNPIYAARILTSLRNCNLPFSRVELGEEWWLGRPFDENGQATGDNWNETDDFLTEFLLAIASQGIDELIFDGLLVYFMDPPTRADHFIKCMEQTRLTIHDSMTYMDKVRESPSYSKVMEAADPSLRLLDLQSLCRLAIHEFSTKVATTERGSVPARSILMTLSRSLPKQLEEFLLYDDIRESLEGMKKNAKTERCLIDCLNEVEDSNDEWDDELDGIGGTDASEDSDD